VTLIHIEVEGTAADLEAGNQFLNAFVAFDRSTVDCCEPVMLVATSFDNE